MSSTLKAWDWRLLAANAEFQQAGADLAEQASHVLRVLHRPDSIAYAAHDTHPKWPVLRDRAAHLSLWAKRWRNLDTFGPTTIMQ